MIDNGQPPTARRHSAMMTKLVDFIARRALVLGVVLATTIAWASLTPIDRAIAVAGSDKLHHFIAYLALSAPLSLRFRRLSSIITAIFACFIFGCAIELIQPYVGRQGDWRDALANLIGIMAGFALGELVVWLNEVRRTINSLDKGALD